MDRYDEFEYMYMSYVCICMLWYLGVVRKMLVICMSSLSIAGNCYINDIDILNYKR